jgi:hypothetical protein
MNQDQPKTKYQEYLESSHWAMLREVCFKRDGYRCLSCRGSCQINAHHLIYRNLFDCTVHDVMTLCWGCHETIHNHMKIGGIKSGFLGALDVLSILRRSAGKYQAQEHRPKPVAVLSLRADPAFPPEGDGPFFITEHFMRLIRTNAGGYTGATLTALGVPIFPTTGWMQELIGRPITKEDMMRIYENRNVMSKRTERRARNRRLKAEGVVPVNFKAAPDQSKEAAPF